MSYPYVVFGEAVYRIAPGGEAQYLSHTLWFSSRRGGAWTKVAIDTVTSEVSEYYVYPVIANNGPLFFAAVYTPDGNKFYKSTNEGATWIALEPSGLDSLEGQFLCLCAGGVFGLYDGMGWYYSTGLSAWQYSEWAEAPTVLSHRGQVYIDASETIHVVYVGGDLDSAYVYYTRSLDFITWSEPEELAETSELTATISGAGSTLYVLAQGEGEIGADVLVIKSTNSGLTWNAGPADAASIIGAFAYNRGRVDGAEGPHALVSPNKIRAIILRLPLME